MNWYVEVMRKTFTIEGRARRKEYWMFILVLVAISLVAGVLDAILGVTAGIIGGIVALVHLIPSITAGIRRLHDIGKSGWFMLINLIPFVGWLIVLYWMVKAGDVGSNAFGADPKDAPPVF